MERCANLGDLNICYETLGTEKAPAIVLISGMGEQMIAWPDQFFYKLAQSGFFVVRFDNRDVGGSSKFDAMQCPDLNGAWQNYFTGKQVKAPYDLTDMAKDVVGLLDYLQIERAFVCGFSMGGMIAQNLAYAYSSRIIGTICMGSSTGELDLPRPKTEAQKVMSLAPPELRCEYADYQTNVFNTFSGGSSFYDGQCRYRIALQSYDRCHYPLGVARQCASMLADGNRKKRLSKIKNPALILHGALDPVAQIEHGYALKMAIPNATLEVIDQWGHGLDYPKIWPQLIEYITGFCDKCLSVSK